MKKFANEQETAAKPPEPEGEQAPGEGERRKPDTGESIFDEIEYEQPSGVKWDGSEAELVADETAAEYEEYNTGIALRYTLKKQEIFPVLMKLQYTQKRIALSVITVLLGFVMAILFFMRGASGQNEYTTLGAVCLLAVLIAVLSPLLHLRSSANAAADGSKIQMRIYPDHIEMGEQHGGEIPLDGTIRRIMMKDLIVLYIGSQFIILPIRCVEPAVLPEVQAMILAGTRPEK